MKKISYAWLTLSDFFMLLLCAAPGCMPLLWTQAQTRGGLAVGFLYFASYSISGFSIAIGITGICEIQKERAARLDGEGIQDRWWPYLSIATLLVLNGLVGALTPIVTVPPLVGVILSAILTSIGLVAVTSSHRQPK